MANQLVGAPNMAIVAALIERGADYYCVVDSVANVEALEGFFARRGLTVRVPTPGTALAIGDVIAFGASHPCPTFDKWRQLLPVDAQLTVAEIMPTYF